MIPILLAPVEVELTVQMIKGNDETKARIQRIGLVPGAKITVISVHGGDLIVYVKDVRIALTEQMAVRIMV